MPGWSCVAAWVAACHCLCGCAQLPDWSHVAAGVVARKAASLGYS